jgi:endoglycosylceramidase
MIIFSNETIKGVMPHKNHVNQTYLNEITKIVDRLASYGIYTLIDLHQDMMSSKFDSYDGFAFYFYSK